VSGELAVDEQWHSLSEVEPMGCWPQTLGECQQVSRTVPTCYFVSAAVGDVEPRVPVRGRRGDGTVFGHTQIDAVFIECLGLDAGGGELPGEPPAPDISTNGIVGPTRKLNLVAVDGFRSVLGNFDWPVSRGWGVRDPLRVPVEPKVGTGAAELRHERVEVLSTQIRAEARIDISPKDPLDQVYNSKVDTHRDEVLVVSFDDDMVGVGVQDWPEGVFENGVSQRDTYRPVSERRCRMLIEERRSFLFVFGVHVVGVC
jgi:hypothetical protein